jgi:DinB superfamily
MHPSLVGPWTLCEDTRREVLALMAEAPPARWTLRRGPRRWTVAEQVDHLIRSEIGTSKMARRLIRGDFRERVRPPEALFHGSALEAYPYGPLDAPEGLVPAAPSSWDETRVQLDAAHRRFAEELARFEGPDADTLAAPDPATGVWFTLGGWVRLQALHEAHHLRQMRALLGGA